MAVNEKYSYNDFTHKTFLDVDPDEFSNSEIVGSCFYQESPYSEDASHGNSANHRNTEVDVFPPGTHSVTFRGCNLDNCKIPGPPSQIIGGSHRRIRVMNDLEDWVLDDGNNKPKEPIARELYERQGLSIDPADISETKRSHPITRGN